MTKQELQNYCRRIDNSLEQKRLKETFDILTLLLSKQPNWQLNEKLTELEDTYKTMLSYLTEGVNDPGREKVFNDLLRAVYQAADSIRLLYKKNFDSENKQERSLNLISLLEEITGKIALLDLLDEEEKSQDLIDLEKQKELMIRSVFYNIGSSEQWHINTKEQWSQVLKSKLTPPTLSNLIVTALTLNLLESFDEQKALLLFDAAENEDEEIKQRALTGIILFLRLYDRRLHLYPAINSRLQHLAENPLFIQHIRHLVLQFILCRETEKITKKIKEEILPEMMKISPKLNSKIKLEDLMSQDSGMEDKNPEWQELIKGSGLEDKLQEFSELQMEGADVMHSSFTHLKNYPFFNEVSNWFLPFSVPAEFLDNQEMIKLAETLSASKMMCNSDKYSFYYSIATMPESYRKMMIGQFSAEASSIQEMLKEDAINDSKKINPAARQYIQDLYRFYKLHPKKKDFEDIFEATPEFYQVPSIAQLIGDKENLFIIGEFYFNKNYFVEAVDIYSQLLKEDPNNHILYQKKGYCLQMQGRLQEALDIYLKAELFDASNPWIIKKLAYCYRTLKQPEEALLYYKKAEQFNPDNLFALLNIGHCHLELKNYDEALKYYFKVEYMEKNKQKAWRPIAWCSFLIHKHEQAMDYFYKIIDSNPNATDYLNAGHTQLAMGNIKEAVRLYGLSLKHPDNSLDKFIESFANDISDIVQAGVNEQDISFILDRIMYDM